ncbi:hypothetical protein ABW21_db0206945 [Orbilia brochopaga]|nr:hypothetical protein ABW21_db0206945 [Drechslerella brochopaga]
MNSSRQNEDHNPVSPSSPTSSSRASVDALVSNDDSSETIGNAFEGSRSSSTKPSSSQVRRYVRFDVAEQSAASDDRAPIISNGLLGATDALWTTDDDFLNSSDDDDFAQAVERGTAPLLTNIAAPSVVIAGMDLGSPEDPSVRSGMKMAFMNMANSIMSLNGRSATFPSLKEVPVLWLLTNRRAVIILCVVGISFPLSLYRDIAKLAKASALALVSMLVIIFTVIVQGILVGKDLKGEFTKPLLTLNSGVFQAIGVISFDHNSLLIYGSLRKPTLDRFARVTHYSTSISMVACMAMALAGFLTFGDKTMGNVLNNFPSSNLMVNVARFCFGLNMLTTLPLEAFVCREVMLNYWYPGSPFDLWRHLAFTTGLVLSALFFSLLTCDLGAVFELIGATSACALAYILPPLCYIKLSTRSWKTLLAWGCVGFGSSVLVISIVQAFIKIARGHEQAVACGW